MPRTKRIAFVATLGALAAVSATAIDICIPAQPRIAEAFGAPPGAGAALVSAYLLGYGPGQLLWGPLADRYGRLPPLLLALAGFLLAGLVCATTGSFEVLIAARGVQGFMGGGAPVIARAIARDQGGGAESARLISTMTVILGGAPLLAPTLGSGLLTLFDWRSVFWCLVILGALAALASTLVLPRRLPRHVPRPISPLRLLGDARALLRAPDFVAGTAISASVFGGYAAFLAVGAAVAQRYYGVAPEAFGPIFAIAAVAFVLGSVLARQAIGRFGVEPLLTAGAALVGLAGALLLLAVAARPPLPLFWALISLYVLAFGMLLPSATSKALEPTGEMAGFGSSLIGVIQVLAGALGAALAGADLFDGAYAGLCWVMGVAALACAALRTIALIRGAGGRS